MGDFGEWGILVKDVVLLLYLPVSTKFLQLFVSLSVLCGIVTMKTVAEGTIAIVWTADAHTTTDEYSVVDNGMPVLS